MTADSGRTFLIKKGGTALAGAQTESMSIDNSPVDVTDKSSGGWRELGDFTGTRTVDLSISGVWKDDTLRDAAFGADDALLLSDITLTFGDGAAFGSSSWFLANYEETGEHAGAVTFTASLQNSGSPAFTTAA
jgi:predicted secreted protein